jgi:hypothetical protein
MVIVWVREFRFGRSQGAEEGDIYRKIMDDSDVHILQIDLDRLRLWAVENAVKIIAGTNKVLSFTRALVKDSLNLFFRDQTFRKKAAASI